MAREVWRVRKHFYPRPPGGGRHDFLMYIASTAEISIHALRVEGDIDSFDSAADLPIISIHALRVEGDAPGL